MAAVSGFVLDCSVALGAFFADEQDAYSVAVWHSMAEAPAYVRSPSQVIIMWRVTHLSSA